MDKEQKNHYQCQPFIVNQIAVYTEPFFANTMSICGGTISKAHYYVTQLAFQSSGRADQIHANFPWLEL